MSEYKINMDRPDPTPEEIAAKKDFSKVLNRYSMMTKPIYTKSWFLSSAMLVVAAGILVMVNLFNSKKAPVADKEVDQSYVYQPAKSDLIPLASFVNPPLDGVDVGYETYEVDAGEKTKLDYHTGTQIKVPKNAFVDAEGNDIVGDVKVKYREFHDVADFFVSGIPMDYDSSGVKYHFESAGMMEILAYKDGEPVFLKPHKEIKVEMASNYDGKHYNLYKLDPANQRWDYRGKDEVTPVEGHDSRSLDEVAALDLEDNPEEDYFTDDNRSAEIVPEKELTVKQLERDWKKVKVKFDALTKAKPVEPKGVNKTRYNFDIAVDPEEFPEITTYEGTRFEIGDENKNFTAEMYKIAWEDVLLEEKVPGINYNLTLTKGQTKYTWVVYPVYEGKDLEKAQKVFKEKFGSYKKKLDTRKHEEKLAKEAYEADLAKWKQKRQEQLAKWEAQRKQFEEAQRRKKERFLTQQQVTRAFKITSFGTWNCDSPVPQPKGKSVAATFTDQNGNPLLFTSVYLVQKDRNAMFTYSAGMLHKFKFNPDEQNVIWGVTSDNRLAIFKADRFSEIPDKGRSFTFKMEIIPDNLVSVDAVREAINI
ncbi:MAG: hypothetical protein JKY52_10625 [Flavobacteriales bacterium]|nr:hypothetical protein [Flavobacteriales bacterium]